MSYFSAQNYNLRLWTTSTSLHMHQHKKVLTYGLFVYVYTNIHVCNIDMYLLYISMYILCKLRDTKDLKSSLLSFSL